LVAHSAAAAQTTSRLPFDEALPARDFLRDLHREKRRAERSSAPLSLVLYRADGKNAVDGHETDRMLRLLLGAKRETDILGRVSDDTIAVLCPDTSEEGTRCFVRKIDALAGDLPFTAVSATYPDHLFDGLAKGTPLQPHVHPYLVSDTRDLAASGYRMKRALDIVGALLAICVFGPLMLLIGAAVALTSKGPVIFKQTRLGKGGVPFTFYKFRSMVTNMDDTIHREFVANLIKGGAAETDGQEAGPAPFKLRSDPRVTPIGRFIRKTSLDELPQFFNVLKGDMSLVGPRPPIPYEAENYLPWHLRRVLATKPGITGIWQVEGRSKVSFDEMVRMDLRYVRNCSFALDLQLLLRTVKVVLRCEGAK
jgi:lipopolysaccharide/colanic/teichoic acid biosynthesis glycosyltransferase